MDYRIAGTTRLDGQIVQATLRLYESITGELRATTKSDPTTGEYAFLSSGVQTGDPYWGETRMLLEFENSLASSGLETWSGTAVGAVTSRQPSSTLGVFGWVLWYDYRIHQLWSRPHRETRFRRRLVHRRGVGVCDQLSRLRGVPDDCPEPHGQPQGGWRLDHQ